MPGLSALRVSEPFFFAASAKPQTSVATAEMPYGASANAAMDATWIEERFFAALRMTIASVLPNE